MAAVAARLLSLPVYRSHVYGYKGFYSFRCFAKIPCDNNAKQNYDRISSCSASFFQLKLESMAGFSSTQKALTLMSRTFPIKLISSSFPRFISTISASDASSTLNHRSLPLNEEGLVEDPFWSNPLQPQRCVGCGISFQTEIPKATGFVDKKKMEEFSGGRKKVYPKMKGHWVETSPEGVKVMKEESSKFRIRTKLLLCQRCYRLQFYKKYDFSRLVASDESLPHPFLGETEMAGFVSKILSNIRKDSLVLKMIDILDIESSIVPELFEGCRNRRLQVIWVINKIDCLPKGVDFGEVKQWIRRLVRQIKNAHVDDIILLSSLTGLHFEELETSMKRFINIDQPKSIYVVGRVNSGKSTFVNGFLKFIGYRHTGTVFMKRGVGGVTRSAIPGTTLECIPFGLPKGFKFIDTPGIPCSSQITALLKHDKDLFDILPTKHIQPQKVSLAEGKTLLIGALARVDLISGVSSICLTYFSNKIKYQLCNTNKAGALLERNAGTILKPPCSVEGFHSLKPFECHRILVHSGSNEAKDDIVIAGLGWFSIYGGGNKEFHVWVPRGVHVFRRPSMLPHGLLQTTHILSHSKSRM